MPRATNNVAARRRKKKILKQAKGNFGGRSKLHRTAKETVRKSLKYAYRDRRNRKRDFRRLWITRISAACRVHGVRYSQFMAGLKEQGIILNRKVLSNIAATDQATFEHLVDLTRAA
ncbi:MAG: 50S ribosomal protein L20 [candidate division Zixibacteria bacterium]|jgi:large subunit ribosomal protein L20|nr:50S ribosomal protein L20 [candidate division Zixibacteria bacterium]